MWLIGLIGVFLVLFAGVFAPYNPLTTNPTQIALAPSSLFLLGTDTLGRDVLSRVLHGGQVSALLAIGATGIGVGLGGLLGASQLISGRIVRTVVEIIEATLLSLPAWLMTLVCLAGLGTSWEAVILGVGLSQIAPFSRLTIMTLRHIQNRPFVEASIASGASYQYITLRVILPNASPILTGLACITLSNCLLFASGLTFLGLGGSLSTPEWGAMLAEGRLAIRYAPWIVLSAGLPLVLVLASLNRLGRRLSLRGWSS